MGVDAVARTANRLPAEVVPLLREKFHEDFPEHSAARQPACCNDGCPSCWRWPTLDHDGEVLALDRYYGPGYERGHWPTIRSYITWLQRHTEGDVTYGGDSSEREAHPVVTADLLADLDRMWETVGNEPYRSHFRNLGGPS